MIDKLKVSTTRLRLSSYRQLADSYALSKDGKRFAQAWAHSWLSHRRPLHTEANNTRGENGEIFADNKEQYGQWIGSMDKLGIDHSGWYADDFCEDLIIGGVSRMHTSRGTYYIPVTYCDQWDGCTFWMGDAELVEKRDTKCESNEYIHDAAIRKAACRADLYAEHEAEECRAAQEDVADTV